MQNYIFEDIIVDIDEILPPTKNPEQKVKSKKGSWDSGTKENIWRGVDPKDIWTADKEAGSEKEPWDAGTDADGQPNPPAPDDQGHQEAPIDDQEGNQEGGAFGDIF